MRRASSTLAPSFLSRALASSSSASGHDGRHRLLQAALYGSATGGGGGYSRRAGRRWFSRLLDSPRAASLGIAGAVFAASAASAALSGEVLAKEPPSPEVVPKEVVLYQYEACPFCNKVKAFLDYYDIPYKVVEVNPISKKEIKWSDYKKVPILMVDGEQLVDSSDIINKLGQKILPERSAKPATEDDDNEERKWRRWVDNHLVHVLSPNIYRNTSEALESFDYITSNAHFYNPGECLAGKNTYKSNRWITSASRQTVVCEFLYDRHLRGNFSFTEKITVKYAGAAAMYFVSKNLKKKYNITDERAALYDAVETWVDALNGREFLGGSKPNLADLAVFGVLRPIRYLRSGKDMVEHTRIGEWYTRMESAVGESSRIKV